MIAIRLAVVATFENDEKTCIFFRQALSVPKTKTLARMTNNCDKNQQNCIERQPLSQHMACEMSEIINLTKYSHLQIETKRKTYCLLSEQTNGRYIQMHVHSFIPGWVGWLVGSFSHLLRACACLIHIVTDLKCFFLSTIFIPLTDPT